MSENYFTNSVNMAKLIAKDTIEAGSTVIDATVGNGNDTLFLSELVGERGKVYGFDIQVKALKNAEERLNQSTFKNVKLIKDGHENMDNHIDCQVDFVMFNLGYLPRSSHRVTTKSETTLVAIEKAIELLKRGGIIVVVLYHGHEEGKVEKVEVEKYLSSLNQKYLTVLKYDFINQINNPPILIVVEKKV